MKQWTEKEDDIVKELYLHKTAKQIALILDRPPNSINFRAFKLGLSKTKTYKLSEIKFIVENTTVNLAALFDGANPFDGDGMPF